MDALPRVRLPEAFPGRQPSYGREHGITVIDGGCPLMFKPTADTGHKIMRRFARSGNVPKTVT